MAVDLKGKVFGRLTVLERAHQNKWGNYFWKCVCSCGNEAIVTGGNLNTGTTKSCGCFKLENQQNGSITHGLTNTPEYYSWQDIRKRCSGYNEKTQKNYVERGIKVHEDFQNSFEAFYNEIGPRPLEDGLWSVGRVDNNLGYTYGNIRWELPEQQARNRTKCSNNKTGVTGVSYYDGNFIAQSTNLDKTKHSKTFSVAKYGYDEAFRLAVAARALMIENLNKQGAGYSDNHGKDK